jgi:lysozyme
MRISQTGVDLIKHFESLQLDAYRCSAGVWTIGYGHTKGVKQGDRITEQEAERLLESDLELFERGVLRSVKVKLTQSQFDALVSFSFNVGLGALGHSTLLRRLNEGDIFGAADQFLRWDKAGGKVLAGLVRRRKAERALFLGQDWRKAAGAA